MSDDRIKTKRTNPGSIYSFSLVFLASVMIFVASFVLSVEALHLAVSPDAKLHCDISATVSCGAVGQHDTASVFGFPNAFIGIASMPVFITLAVLVLSGVKLPKWILQGAWWGTGVSLAFAIWMFYTSYSVIGVLCPWCLVVSFSSVVLWFAMTRFVIIHQQTNLPSGINDFLRSLVKRDYDKLIMCVVLVAMLSAIIIKYF
ncbi:vitamin K epoxide reductase [Candidatus Saccharibacteria bacterium]|nr:MAG: vitamin K epoxide reductase [Candidatus Saccharibacteria bacterium]